jgi:hypothetical protein
MATKEQSAQQGSQSPNPNDDPITIGEFFSLAQKKLPSPVWDYYASGSEEHYSLKRNSNAFERYTTPTTTPNMTFISIAIAELTANEI